MCAYGEMFQLGVEAQRVFKKKSMTDAVVTGDFRGLAVVEYVLSHGWQHHSVCAAMGNEDGHCNPLEN